MDTHERRRFAFHAAARTVSAVGIAHIVLSLTSHAYFRFMQEHRIAQVLWPACLISATLLPLCVLLQWRVTRKDVTEKRKLVIDAFLAGIYFLALWSTAAYGLTHYAQI